MAWFRLGTFSISNNSNTGTITGAGSTMTSLVRAGDRLKCGAWDEEILSFSVDGSGNATVVFASTYTGANISAQPYAIQPTPGFQLPLIQALNAWTASVEGYMDGPLSGKWGNGAAATPAFAFADDIDTGIFRIAANILGIATGGSERLRVTNSGAQLTGLLSGTAVTQSATDTTVGRLLKVGDFGLGANRQIGDFTAALEPGIYSYVESGATGSPGSSSYYGHAYVSKNAGGGNAVIALRGATTAATMKMWYGYRGGATGPFQWTEVPHLNNILGTVSQSGGVPTGAVLQGNANASSPTGGYTQRVADGFQTVYHTLSSSSSADTTWTYNTAFLTGSTPNIKLQPVGDADYHVRLVSRSATACVFSIRDSAGSRVAVPVDAAARGRWSNMA